MVAIDTKQVSSATTFSVSGLPSITPATPVHFLLIHKGVNPGAGKIDSAALQALKQKKVEPIDVKVPFAWCKEPSCFLCFFNKDK